eukprot:4871277-Ditylum_brightwellii.AAC.1
MATRSKKKRNKETSSHSKIPTCVHVDTRGRSVIIEGTLEESTPTTPWPPPNTPHPFESLSAAVASKATKISALPKKKGSPASSEPPSPLPPVPPPPSGGGSGGTPSQPGGGGGGSGAGFSAGG